MIENLVQMVAQLVGLVVIGLAVPLFLVGVTAIYESIMSPRRKARPQHRG